jgi:dUTP pyrophosphatase
MKINIINKSQHALPNYETIASAGMDLRANLTESVTLQPLGEQWLKRTFIELPIGYEAQVRPRSGLAFKTE